MTVTVLLFASYADALGMQSMSLDVTPGAHGAATSSGTSARCPARSDCRAAARRGERAYAKADRVLRAGDEVAIIPPVAGG